MSKNKNTSAIIASAKKFADDKKAIRAYIKGELTLKDLNERGIKLAMPL
ncbi:hypothetical protein [Flavobacterium sp. 38-13]|nr:hypothetical protein [Flavobacterium sp. 38-13]